MVAPTQDGCQHHHAYISAKRGIEAIMRSPQPLTRPRGAKAWHYIRCGRTRSDKLRARRRLLTLRAWRKDHAGLLQARRLWAYYRAHPMPWCSWGPESGGSYTARNPTSTAGGKYQIIDSTWYANGGSRYYDSHPAAAAPPLEQEKVGRNVLNSQGLGAWVNC